MPGKPISPTLQGENKAAADGWTDGRMYGRMDGWMRIRGGKKDETGRSSNQDPKPHSPV